MNGELLGLQKKAGPVHAVPASGLAGVCMALEMKFMEKPEPLKSVT